MMTEKLKLEQNRFSLSTMEQSLVDHKKDEIVHKLRSYEKQLTIISWMGYEVGITFIDYENRNDFAEYLRQQEVPIDFVMMISLVNQTISYRSIRDGANVRLIAEKMGGNGHDSASSSPINSDQIKRILDLLLSK